MQTPTVKTLSIRALHRLLENGVFAIPQIQREFVWNGRKAAALLDSIYRRMPIGSLMIWKTKRENYHLLRKNLHILPQFQECNDSIWFLIDGQQRLSVLHQVAAGGTQTNGNGQVVDFSRISFRLAKPSDEDRMGRTKSTRLRVGCQVSCVWTSPSR